MPRYANELHAADFPIHYDSEATGLRELTALTSAHCRQLLDELVTPKIKELRAWLKELDKLTAVFEEELSGYATFQKKADQTRLPDLKHAIRLIDDGLIHRGKVQGISMLDVERLEVMKGKPGRKDTKAILETLARDEAFLKATVALWPNAETKQPHIYNRVVEGEFEGSDIKPGDIRQLTERQARSLVNIFVLQSEPAILSGYREALHALGTDNPTTIKKAVAALDAVIAGSSRKAA